MNIVELTKLWKEKEDKIKKKKESIERLQKQLKKLESKNHWIDTILKPIAQEMSTLLELPTWDILGPFGLNCDTSIHFSKDVKSLQKLETIKSITFTPHWDKENNFHLYIQSNINKHLCVEVTDFSIEQLIKKWAH